MMPGEPIAMPQGPPSRAAVEDAVRGVFADDPALAESLRAATAPPSDRKGFLEWLGETWQDLQHALADLQVESPLLYWLTLAGLLLVLGLLLLHIGWTIARAVRDYRADAPEAVTVERAERRRRHAEWLEAARDAARHGDRRAAVRMLVLSLLALLEERNVLHYATSWTTREILGRLGAKIGATREIAAFGRGVERASYGAAEPLPEEFARLEQTMLQLAATTTDSEARPS
jgi:hypothetical protein